MIDTVEFKLNLNGLNTAIRNNLILHFNGRENNTIVRNSSEVLKNFKAHVYKIPDYTFLRKKLGLQIHIPSSEYNVHCMFDEVQNEITFNLSVGKYLYGTNFFLPFILHNVSEIHPLNQNPDKYTLQKTFIILNTVIHHCIHHLIDENYQIDRLERFIEITRLDICKNILFQTPEECQEYLSALRKFKIKYKDIEHNNIYKGSIMFRFDDYSVKIYEKGKEMLETKGHKIDHYHKFEQIKIQELASRTARLEITIRTGKLKDLFLNSLFASEPIYNGLPDREKKKLKKGNLILNYPRFDNFTGESKNRKMKFTNINPTFDIYTFQECVFFAHEKFKMLLLDDMPSYKTIKDQIENYSQHNKIYHNKNISKSSFMKIINLLRNRSLNELVKDEVISKASKYNYIKKLASIGIYINQNSKIDPDTTILDKDGSLFLSEQMEFEISLIEKTYGLSEIYTF